MTDPVIIEFDNVASGYFTSRKLVYINNTVNELLPTIELLDPSQAAMLDPLYENLEKLEQESKTLNRKSNYSLVNTEKIIPESIKLQDESQEMLSKIREAALQAEDTLNEVNFSNIQGVTT